MNSIRLMQYSRLLAVALTAAQLLLTGCRPEGPVTYPVTGSVTLGGDPVAEGEILFRAADGAQGSWAAKIVGGSYSLESTAGAKRVEITAHRQIEVAPSASGEGGVNYQMYIPEKYNEKSELTAEVTANGTNQFDFALEP